MRRMESASCTDMEPSEKLTPSSQLADADVAHLERAGVVALDTDQTARCEPVVRVLGELAARHAFLPVIAAEVVLDDPDAVQPVLDVIAAHDEPRLVPVIIGLRDARR